MSSKNPILNSPYYEPILHYATDPDGSLNYNDIRKGRRIFTTDIQVIPSKQGPQTSIFEVNDFASEYGTHIVCKNKRPDFWPGTSNRRCYLRRC